jgi:nuclear pore complex protein Nup54
MFGQPSSGSPFGSSAAGTSNPSQPGSSQPAFSFGNNNNRASSFLFGSQPAQTSGFGQNNSANQPSLFGSSAAGGASQTQPQASGGLFGQNSQNAQNKPASTGLFGQSSTQNNTASTGLFGQNNQNPSGGLFGQNSTQNSTSGGLFGQNNNQSSTSGGLFGQSNTQNNQNNQSGGLFGLTNTQNNQNNQAGGLFGANSANSNTSTFGKPAGTSALGGLFGGLGTTTANNTLGGLFGGSNTNTLGGLFANNSNNTSSGLFSQGNNTNNSLFNQNNNSLVFGQNNQTQNNTTVSNNPQPSFGWNSQKPAAPAVKSIMQVSRNEPAKNNYTPAISDQLLKIKEQWDPLSPKLALKTHFYNKVSDNEISAVLNQPRPQNETPEDWDAAMSNRPSSSYYPVKVTSYTDVAQRVEVQLDHVAKSRVILNEILQKQSALSSKHDLDNTTRILRAKAKHAKLLRRLLRLATILAVLKLKGYPLLPEEEELSKQFDLLNGMISDPNSPLGRLNDIFARVTILKERSEELNRQFDTTVRSMSSKDEDDVNNEEIIKKVSQLLLKQQVGLNHLNKVIAEDTEKVEKLK